MNYRYDFVRHRKKFFLLSAVIILLGVLSLIIMGFNLGVDFQSGTRLDVHLGQTFEEEDVRSHLNEMGHSPGSVLTAGDQKQRAVVRFTETLEKEEVNQILERFQSAYGEEVSISESTVDPSYSAELVKKAFYAVCLASLGIILYVTIRFEIRFAVAAVVALAHDAFVVIALFSLFHVEVNLSFVAAILTIVGYSINDTIVLFDRIRENMRHAKVKTMADLGDVVNVSLNETLTRSINTVLTVVFAATALLLLGGTGIQNFALAMTLGLIAGAYSSIFIASQVWLEWKGRAVEKERFDAQEEDEV